MGLSTLLAQADSCIGSKSSVNVGPYKNLLGTFTPPERVIVDAAFLGTLEEQDMRSGVGEMLKVHLIKGPEAFAEIARDWVVPGTDKTVEQLLEDLQVRR